MTDCTLTLSSLQRIKAVMLHERATCDPSARGAFCVTIKLRLYHGPDLDFCLFYSSICRSHVLTLPNSSLSVFHLTSEWTAQPVMSISGLSHTHFLSLFSVFQLCLFRFQSSCAEVSHGFRHKLELPSYPVLAIYWFTSHPV